MNIADIIAALTGGADPNKAILQGADVAPSLVSPPSQAAPQAPPPNAPQGIPTPLTNPQQAASAPTATQSPPDLANMYIELMKKNQNAQQLDGSLQSQYIEQMNKQRNAASLDSGLSLIAAGLSNSPTNRAALIQGSLGGHGGGGMSLSANDMINFQKQAEAQKQQLTMQQALPALMKQYKMTDAQIKALQASGQLGEVVKHYSTENLGHVEDKDTGKTILFNQRTGQPITTIGGEAPDPTQVVTGPQGPQVINMRTGAPVGAPVGPTGTNIDAKGTKYPDLDKGFDYARDEKGLVKLTDGKPVVAPIAGSTAEKEQIDAAQKKVEQKIQSSATIASVVNAGKAVETAIDESFLRPVGLGSKAVHTATGWLGGTSGNIVRDNLDTIKANASFEKLAQMRQASPTGGALGNISDFENRLLSSATATLSPNLPAEKLIENVHRVQATMELLSNKSYKDEAAFNADLSKRLNELKLERANRAPANKGITVTRE
jgi:hypothetical protein